MAFANCLCLTTNCDSGTTPNCHSPHGSLPMPQYFTRYGSGWPFLARSAPIRVVAAPFMYSTYSAADQASPKPAFTVMYGSTSSSRHSVMNSSVPTSLGWTAFQAGSSVGGRRSRSPIASRQSCADTKLPPGKR